VDQKRTNLVPWGRLPVWDGMSEKNHLTLLTLTQEH
jgi:hypothetical protein